MDHFIANHADRITGGLSGFDVNATHRDTVSPKGRNILATHRVTRQQLHKAAA